MGRRAQRVHSPPDPWGRDRAKQNATANSSPEEHTEYGPVRAPAQGRQREEQAGPPPEKKTGGEGGGRENSPQPPNRPPTSQEVANPPTPKERGVRVVVLGQPGDHHGVEEPALRCRAPPEGRREPGGTPGGVSSPGGPREGPQVSYPGDVARQGADVAGLPGRGGRYSASRMRTPTTGSPRPCAAPSPTGATTGATRRRHSPSPHTSGGAGDGPNCRREKVGGGAGPPDPRPPHGTACRRSARPLLRGGGRRQRARG